MKADSLNLIFAALADPTRRAILGRLLRGESNASELGVPFALSQPAISKHLKVLEAAGLIARRREAQRRPCALEAGPLREAARWLAPYGMDGKATRAETRAEPRRADMKRADTKRADTKGAGKPGARRGRRA